MIDGGVDELEFSFEGGGVKGFDEDAEGGGGIHEAIVGRGLNDGKIISF